MLATLLLSAPHLAVGAGATDADPSTTDNLVLTKPTSPLRAALAVDGSLRLLDEIQFHLTISSAIHPADVTGVVTLPAGLQTSDPTSFTYHADSAAPRVFTVSARVVEPGVHEVRADVSTNVAGVALDILFLDFRTPLGSVHRSDPRAITAGLEQVVEQTVGGPVGALGTLSFRITLRVDNWDNNHYGSSFDSQPRRFVYVELWDREGCCSGDYLLRSGYVDGNGFISWDVNNDDGPFQSTLDPYLKIFSRARPSGQAEDKATVVNPDNSNQYVGQYNWGDNLPDQTITVTLSPATSNDAAPFYILSRAIQAYNKAVEGGIFTPGPVTLKWKDGYNTGTSYSSNVIHIQGITSDPDQFDHDVIEHEYGHHFMSGLYGGQWPTGATGSHPIDTCIARNLAWTEGFANWFQGAAQGASDYTDALAYSGTSWGVNVGNFEVYRTGLEGQCTIPGTSTIGTYEFSITGTLWDIFDSVNDDTAGVAGYDSLSDGTGSIYDILRNYRDGTAPTIVQNVYEFHDGWHSRARPNEALMHEILREHGQL